MARFDVHCSPDGIGYILNCQSDLLNDIRTRVVVPLLPPEVALVPAGRLNPVFEIEGQMFTMIPQFIASVPKTMLGPAVISLADFDTEITGAIDMLLSGI